jgi:hypothetical protein
VQAGSVRETSERLARVLMNVPVHAPSAEFSFEAACERVASVLRSHDLLVDGSGTGSG